MRYSLTILLVILCFNLAFNQQTIKGNIYDSENNPLLGANVIIKGRTNGTVTDINGAFSINANEGDILVISYAGYQTYEIIILSSDFDGEIDFAFDENNELSRNPWPKVLSKKIKLLNDSCKLVYDSIVKLAIDQQWQTEKMITQLKESEDNCQKIRDYLYNIFPEIPNFFSFLFPIKNQMLAIKYYEGINTFDFIDENNLGFGRNNTHFSNKLVTVYGGVFQFSFNSNLSKANSVKLDLEKIKSFDKVQLNEYLFELDSLNRANSTLMKIASGGGEASFNMKTTILNLGMKNKKSRFKFQTEISGRFSFDIPLADTYIEGKDWSIFGSLGLLNMAIYNFTSGNGTPSLLSIFGAYSPIIVHGSKKFYSNAYFSSTNPFFMQDIAVGLRYDYVDLFFTMQFFSKNNNPDDGLSGRVGFKFNNLFQKKQ
ncbi:MAG TPA: carboxypeptidase-like regulatory domain-containing protein [Saprospiraceae bacterium]|nr:carboxypeptidase-like regulatory domain-containing protein [Saprospiraceae bacterium]